MKQMLMFQQYQNDLDNLVPDILLYEFGPYTAKILTPEPMLTIKNG